MKRLIVLGILSLLSMQLLMAQPPVPTNPDGGFKAPEHSINRQTRGPVGTASLLLLTLGGATLGYKIVNNKKNNNRKEN